MHVDHVTPANSGGPCITENLAAACGACNAGKSDRDIEAFRWCLAVRRSPIHGLVTAKQAAGLQAIGVALPVEPCTFHFEKLLEPAQ